MMFGILPVRLRFRGVDGAVFSGFGVADRRDFRGDFGGTGIGSASGPPPVDDCASASF